MTNSSTNDISGEALDLAGKHIVLGLTGGIACYKATQIMAARIMLDGRWPSS
jgi:phosphopantothenoylcysteine decarboxylase/phosphopantothenate--cysteine ligase